MRHKRETQFTRERRDGRESSGRLRVDELKGITETHESKERGSRERLGVYDIKEIEETYERDSVYSRKKR